MPERTDAGTDGPGPAQRERCDFCRLPVPGEPVVADCEGETYSYCCRACAEAVEEGGQVFTQYHGFRRVPTGVAPVDESLPQGVPRNSFVLLTDLAGTRTEAVQAELVWRTLQRGEPAVFVSFLEPPMSVVQEFVALDWNVLPYLESGQLQILDCFTYRLENRERMYERLSDWNAFLSGAAADATTQVRDPTELGELHNRLDDVLTARGMEDRGVVVVDSLTEFGALVQPIRAYDFLKDVRAEVCKSRFVPIFAGATVSSEGREFPHDLEYMVDGIVELSLDDELVAGSLVKQLRVRKMSGVVTRPEWTAYEYAAGDGIVAVDVDRRPGGDGRNGRAGGGRGPTPGSDARTGRATPGDGEGTTDGGAAAEDGTAADEGS